MGFLRAVASAFLNVINFGGRASRAEFWYFQLFLYGLAFGGAFFIILGLHPEQALALAAWLETSPWYLGISLFIAVQGWSLMVRRLHDTDRSGFWSLMIFVPLIGFIVLLVFAVQPGDRGDNRFGPPPGCKRARPPKAPRGQAPQGKTEDDRKAEVRALYQARVKCLSN